MKKTIQEVREKLRFFNFEEYSEGWGFQRVYPQGHVGYLSPSIKVLVFLARCQDGLHKFEVMIDYHLPIGVHDPLLWELYEKWVRLAAADARLATAIVEGHTWTREEVNAESGSI